MSGRDMGPDGLPDDRKTCRECKQMGGRGNTCSVFNTKTMPDLPRRCVHFIPYAGAKDQRTGKERWPDILKQIEEIRAFERSAPR